MPKQNISTLSVTFDEENLEKNEIYFAENPSVTKINEPKTPFHKNKDETCFENNVNNIDKNNNINIDIEKNKNKN
jgi:hypothetical protein